jgi:hypothetical protein
MPEGQMRAARCRHDASAARIRAKQVLLDRDEQARWKAKETLRTNLRTAADVAVEAASHGVVSGEEAKLLIESAAKARAATDGVWPINDRRPVSPGAVQRVAEASARLERALRIVREDAEDKSAEEQRIMTSQRRVEKKERRRVRRDREREEAAEEAMRAALQRRIDEDHARCRARALEEEREQRLQALQERIREDELMAECFDFSRTPPPENPDDIHGAIGVLVDTYNTHAPNYEIEVVDAADEIERAAARARQAAHELQQDDLLACQELEEALRESEDEFARVLEADAREERASSNCSVSHYGECIMCLSERATHAVVPCGHMVVCETCSGQARLEQCPLCRGTVAQLMRVFIA